MRQDKLWIRAADEACMPGRTRAIWGGGKMTKKILIADDEQNIVISWSS
jgi:hypothetical protein